MDGNGQTEAAARARIDHERFVSFMQELEHDDDLVAVLRSHLYVEMELGRLLALVFPNAESLLAMVSYHDKITLTKRYRVLPKSVRRLLLAVGDLRNSFAHPPLKKMLTNEDLNELCEATPNELLNSVASFLAKYPGRDTLGGNVRAILANAYLQIWYTVREADAKKE